MIRFCLLTIIAPEGAFDQIFGCVILRMYVSIFWFLADASPCMRHARKREPKVNKHTERERVQFCVLLKTRETSLDTRHAVQ